MRNSTIHGARVLLLGASALAVALFMQPDQASARDVRVAHHYVQKSIQGDVDQSFADDVNANTDLNVQIFWSGALGSGREIVDLVGGGAVEMGATVPSYTPAKLTIGSIGTVPMLYFDTPEIALAITREVLADPAAVAEYERANLEPLVLHTTAPYRLVCNKPVETMADFQGLKVRTFGALASKALAPLGAVSVTMTSAETYEALQRGTVQCAMYSSEFAIAQKLHEVAKFWTTLTFGAFSGAHLYANRDFMASLSPETAAAVRAAGRKAEQGEVALNMAAEAGAVETARAAGVTMVEFKETEQFVKALPDTLEMWVEDAVAAGVAKEDAERIASIIRQKSGKN